jgi:hypothetical protein
MRSKVTSAESVTGILCLLLSVWVKPQVSAAGAQEERIYYSNINPRGSDS